jgi:hypothetical protein
MTPNGPRISCGDLPAWALSCVPLIEPSVSCMRLLGRPRSSLMTGFEELDRIAVWVNHLDLPAPWPGFHGVSKGDSGAA